MSGGRFALLVTLFFALPLILAMNYIPGNLHWVGQHLDQLWTFHHMHDYVNPRLNQVQCQRAQPIDHSIEDLRDCISALKMIPSGQLYIHPEPHRLGRPGRLTLYRHPWTMVDTALTTRQPRFVLPAAFQSRSCLILVAATGSNNHQDGPRNAATAMYFTIWPMVRSLAVKILQGCRLYSKTEPAGFVNTRAILDNGTYLFNYRVMVTGVPHGAHMPNPWPEEGWKIRLDIQYGGYNFYNLYTANGSWFGEGNKGIYDYITQQVVQLNEP